MPRLHLLRTGLLAALLALAGQLAFGASVPAPGLLLPAAICHAGTAHEKPVAPRQHDTGCLLCPLCAALVSPTPPLASPPVLPNPPTVAAEPATIWLPGAARPATILSAAQPRGPPSLAWT